MRVTGATFPLLHVPSMHAQVQRDRLCCGTVRLVAGLSPRRTGFDPTQFQFGMMVDKVTVGQIFLRALRLMRGRKCSQTTQLVQKDVTNTRGPPQRDITNTIS